MRRWSVKITVEYVVTSDDPENAVDRAYDYLDSEPNIRHSFTDVEEITASSDIDEITGDE